MVGIALVGENEDGIRIIKVFVGGDEKSTLSAALTYAEDYIREWDENIDEIALAEKIDTLKHQYEEAKQGLYYVNPVEVGEGEFIYVLPAPIMEVGDMGDRFEDMLP